MNKKIFLTIGLAISIFGLTAKGVSANYQYGDSESHRQIIVDKKIKSIDQNYWSDNLSSDNILFTAEELVFFKIYVKNTGDETLKNITLIDYIPEYTKYILSDGDFKDTENRTDWTIDQLDPGQEKEYFLRVQVKDSNSLPQGDVLISINKAKVTAESGESDEDTAQFPISTQILAAKLPEAGGSNLLKIIAAAIVGGIGVIARKFGRGEI